MPMMILDKYAAHRMRSERKASGADRWDEVWDGVYMVMPLPNDEHQEIVFELGLVIREALGRGPKIRPGVNVSDRDVDWKQNYRGPDLVVFLEGTTAINRDSHWLGGPDFAVEVVSKGDRSRRKLDFYASVDVRELLLVDRFPWNLELYRLIDGRLQSVGRSTPEDSLAIPSEVLPLSFRLRPGEARPAIEVNHADGVQRWSV